MEESVFAQYLETRAIFKTDRDILRPSYVPERLPHREGQINQLAAVLATALRGEQPSNVLIFGKTGTGKTAVVKYIGQEMKRADRWKRVEHVYLNCKIVDTPYGILQNIGNHFLDGEESIPFTGWATDRVYNSLRDGVDAEKRVVIIALDEIDRLVYKNGDDVLYHLTKLNNDLSQARVSLIGISNDLRFSEALDPRVLSRLSDEKMVFPPYNADELREILMQRADLAFEDGVVSEAVIGLCAAYAAQEHGDARRALDLLRVAAELAERSRDDRITEHHVNKAKNKLELDCVIEAVKSLPTQSKLLLYGIILNHENGVDQLTTGEVYGTYKGLCRKTSMSILTQRRITDLISELDMLGLVYAKVKSFGRGGRTKVIRLSVPSLETKRAIEVDEGLDSVRRYRMKLQTTLL